MSGSTPTRASDVLAESAPLALVLGVLVAPEPVVVRPSVDHVLTAQFAQRLDLGLTRDHADRRATGVQDVLHGEGAQAARRAPDEHDVALGHRRTVTRDEHPVRGRVAQRVDRRLLPRQVRRFGHELVGLHDRDVGESPEVRLEPPDPLVAREHRVVVTRGILIVDVVAVNGDLVTDLPVAHGRTGPQDDAGGVGTDHVIVQRVTLSPVRLLAQSVQERERRYRLEDARPDRVEVDRRRHHRDDDLVVRDWWNRHFVDVQAPSGVLVTAVHTVEHRLLVATDEDGAGRRGHLDRGQLLARGAGDCRVEDLTHSARLVPALSTLIAAVKPRVAAALGRPR